MMPIYLHSDLLGAPKITRLAGGAIAVYDAVLVTGFNIQSVASATASGGVVTFNFASAPGFEALHRISITGATPSGVNGDWVVQSAASNQVLVAVPGVADGAVTGTIQMRFTPLGWEKVFSAADTAVYRPVDTSGTRPYLRVYDPAGDTFYTRGYMSMSDINTGSNPFPTTTQQSGNGCPNLKGYGTTVSVSSWGFAGDHAGYVFAIDYYGNNFGVVGRVITFGDIVSFKPADVYRAHLSGPSYNTLNGAEGVEVRTMASDWAGTSTAEVGVTFAVGQGNPLKSRVGPDPITGNMIFRRDVLCGNSAGVIRGKFPGQIDLLFSATGIPNKPYLVANVPGVTGRVLIVKDDYGVTGFLLDEAWR